jgi:hypothetical protein
MLERLKLKVLLALSLFSLLRASLARRSSLVLILGVVILVLRLGVARWESCKPVHSGTALLWLWMSLGKALALARRASRVVA